MTLENILANTIITFPVNREAQADRIREAIRNAYVGSRTARAMFESWIGRRRKIFISYKENAFESPIKIETLGTNNAIIPTGEIIIDPDRLAGFSYLDYFGRARPYELIQALVHEFGHALLGKVDNYGDDVHYEGENVRYVNQIWKELGYSPMRSYLGQGVIDRQRTPYSYTKGVQIDTAIKIDDIQGIKDISKRTNSIGTFKDLLIGGVNNNLLESGPGNDFLFGGDGNDTLDGGTGTDTAVYFGNCKDYEIKQNYTRLTQQWDGTWTVRDKRLLLSNVSGTDTLQNIEVVQFDDAKVYLKAGGIKCQSDIAFVIDTTRSMGSNLSGSLNYIQQQAATIIDATFANDQDARVGIVAFKDATNGEPSQVILPFTEQDNFADRKSAAIAAINSLTASGGGDNPETPFDGLRLALNGALGQWRPAAGTLRVVLFTDSPVKDYQIANEVSELAHNIGATVGTSSTDVVPGGYIDTVNLVLNSNSGGTSNVPITPGRREEGANPHFDRSSLLTI